MVLKEPITKRSALLRLIRDRKGWMQRVPDRIILYELWKPSPAQVVERHPLDQFYSPSGHSQFLMKRKAWCLKQDQYRTRHKT